MKLSENQFKYEFNRLGHDIWVTGSTYNQNLTKKEFDEMAEFILFHAREYLKKRV